MPSASPNVLDEIKEKLEAEKKPVICVSTQLIEAGMDIDFGSVIRYPGGDGFDCSSRWAMQPSRRARGLGSVWVVNPQEENLDRLEDIKIGRGHAQRILDDFRDNPEFVWK